MRLLLCSIWLAVLCGCTSRNVRTPAAAAIIAPPGLSYVDLEPGWRLRVITPVLKSGGYQVRSIQEQTASHTVTMKADNDFIGYETAYYAVRSRHGEGVRIQFHSAELSRLGQVTAEKKSIAPLFAIPRRLRRVRLLYLTRVSQADHNMAVLAAPDISSIAALTARVQADPQRECRTELRFACSWIPAGIAVRPESTRQVGRQVQWVPAR